MPFNHTLQYPVLRGGTSITNPNVGRPGTLGLIATTDGNDRWILSAYHVLCREDASMPKNVEEPIYYSTDVLRASPLAVASTAKADKALDCAAARIIGVPALGEILGIGTLTPPSSPVIGMRVVKSGATTGVTEGRITNVTATEVVISPSGMPSRYELSDGGDSGAIWLNAADNSPVVLHTGGNDWGTPERAFGIPVQLALTKLGLRIVM